MEDQTTYVTLHHNKSELALYQQYQLQQSTLPPWRVNLQRTLLNALQEVEILYHSARHFFVIPDNSIVNKLPYFNQAIQQRDQVMLSTPLQAVVAAEIRPRPTRITPRRKPKYLIQVDFGVKSIIFCNIAMMYVLATAPLIDW